jgi:hypothetical protein
MLVFFNPNPAANGFGELSIGLTAGRGIEGAGEADLCTGVPNEDRLLCDVGGGGSMGNDKVVGVPGIDAIDAEGAGDAGASVKASTWTFERILVSGGAGLLADILRPGRSILVTLL